MHALHKILLPALVMISENVCFQDYREEKDEKEGQGFKGGQGVREICLWGERPQAWSLGGVMVSREYIQGRNPSPHGKGWPGNGHQFEGWLRRCNRNDGFPCTRTNLSGRYNANRLLRQHSQQAQTASPLTRAGAGGSPSSPRTVNPTNPAIMPPPSSLLRVSMMDCIC